MRGPSLEEALAVGRGVERPFNHDPDLHGHATSSVNTLKGVWLCYSCQARGAVDSTRVPTVSELEAMLEPEAAARHYPSSWLELFGLGGYWAERFPTWLCWYMGMGEDPFTGEGTYPVHTPAGQLAGVCRRALTEGPWPKYKYPRGWSASRALGGSRGAYRHHDVLMLVEGYADSAAGWEVGVPSFATYGSGVHAPQVQLITAMTPRLILLGQDNDDAGYKAALAATEDLVHVCEIARVDWKEFKDPAEAPVEERRERILDVVPGRYYDIVETGMATLPGTIREIYKEETNA